VHAGDFLVGLFRVHGGATPSVGDNLNGAWIKAPLSNSYTSVWYMPNAKAGATSVTLTSKSPGALRADIAEYSGVATSSPYDAGACNSGSTATVTTGSTASVASGELVFAGVGSSSHPNTVGAGGSNGVPATIRSQASDSNGTMAVEDVTAAAGGLQNATMTINGTMSAGWNACVATFRTASTPLPSLIMFVQSSVQTGNGTSLATSYRLSVQAGDFLVAIFRVNSGGAVSVSDNLNGAWTRAPVTNPYDSIWYLPKAKAGITTVGLTTNSSGQLRAVVAEYSGVATSSPFDSGACNSGSSATVTTGNTASIAAGELVFAGAGSSSNPITVSAGSSNGAPVTIRNQVTNSSGTVAAEDVTSSVAGVQNATMTLNGALSRGWNGCAATFKPALLATAGATLGDARASAAAFIGILAALLFLGVIRRRTTAHSPRTRS
jgi:hypothetical protein